MGEKDFERMLPVAWWQATSEAVAGELVAWREAHPRASLTQIEDAVFEAMQRLQARALHRRLAAIPAVVGVRRWPVADHRHGTARHVQDFRAPRLVHDGYGDPHAG